MLSYEESLKILKETKALIDGHFILSSGLHSPRYVQCAQLLSKPQKAFKLCNSLAEKIKESFKDFDLILSPAMGGVIIGYEIGKILNKETIFSERINGNFTLRRGFTIKKGSNVLIIEDVITTGKSSLECVKLIKKANANLLGFASIIDRSNKKSLKIKIGVTSHLKLNVPTFNKKQLPHKVVELKQHGMNAWPCGEIGNVWDEYGVFMPKGQENTCGKDNVCLGNYDSSYQGTPLDTYFHPSSYESRK